MQDRVVIITGAARGHGSALAALAAKRGAKVVLVDIDEDNLLRVSDELTGDGHAVLPLVLDLARDSDVAAVTEEALARFSRIDVLVNNAATIHYAPVAELAIDDWDAVMQVNLRAVFMLSQAAGRHMLAQGSGVIVNVATMGGHMYVPNGSSYAISKAGVISLTQQLAVEWAPLGIRCNCVSPGICSNPMGYAVPAGARSRTNPLLVPTRRLTTPDDVAATVLFLASDEASAINGVNLVVDGGYSASIQVLRGLASRLLANEGRA